MKNYLDPRVYCYTDGEWESEAFVDRFSDFLSLIQEAEKEEKKVGSEKLLHFRLESDAVEQIYSSNPFLAQPCAKPFYQQQFNNLFLPAILRRIDTCSTASCESHPQNAKTLPCLIMPAIKPSQVFLDQLSLCAICGDNEERCLIHHSGAPSINLPSDFFHKVVDLSSKGLLNILDAWTLFPQYPKRHREEYLRLAVAVERAQREEDDPTWKATKLSNISVTENFWPSFDKADFLGLDENYIRQIIYTLLQISTGKDETVCEHRMIGQSVGKNHEKYNKWNAYVFKMGASDQDKRCSRIYFAKTSSGILLDEYEPDAHP